MTEQHRDIPYRDVEYVYEGEPIAPQWADDQSSFTVTAECPACGLATVKTVPVGLPSENKGWLSTRVPAQPVVPRTVRIVCACGLAHRDRPAQSTETGCGIIWKVQLR